MAGPFLLRDYEWAVQEETTFGTSPGALVGGDFFKHRSLPFVQREIERYFRDRDRDSGQASVLSVHKGREKSKTAIESDLIPSGNATTPTEPDTDVFFKAAFGQKHKATAHTTTAAGSAGTSLVLTTGGVAASGILVGDMIAVDQDGAGNYEVRQVLAIATDTLTIDRALTTNPATGRTVKVGTTYRLLTTTMTSLHLWNFVSNNLRYKVPGFLVQEAELSINHAEGTPVGNVKFSGEGKPLETHATSRPTPVTGGVPLVPNPGILWIGAVKLNPVTGLFNLKTGLELRSREGDALSPTGMKRTGNNSRWEVMQTLEFYAYDGAPDTKTYYDNAPNLTGLDVMYQLGETPGTIVAWRTKSFVPDAEKTEQDGEIGLKLTGRCLGVSGDDEIALAFI